VPATATAVLTRNALGSYPAGRSPLPLVTESDGAAFWSTENQEYVIKQTQPKVQTLLVPILGPQGGRVLLTDGALTVVSRFTTQPGGGFQPSGRFIELWCRRQGGDNFGYQLQVDVGEGRARLNTVYDGNYVDKDTDWYSFSSIKRGDGINKIELRCIGSQISAAINGQTALIYTDTRFNDGTWWLAAGTLISGTYDARFSELYLLRP
jgi:hypothetical protein